MATKLPLQLHSLVVMEYRVADVYTKIRFGMPSELIVDFLIASLQSARIRLHTWLLLSRMESCTFSTQPDAEHTKKTKRNEQTNSYRQRSKITEKPSANRRQIERIRPSHFPYCAEHGHATRQISKENVLGLSR